MRALALDSSDCNKFEIARQRHCSEGFILVLSWVFQCCRPFVPRQAASAVGVALLSQRSALGCGARGGRAGASRVTPGAGRGCDPSAVLLRAETKGHKGPPITIFFYLFGVTDKFSLFLYMNIKSKQALARGKTFLKVKIREKQT